MNQSTLRPAKNPGPYRSAGNFAAALLFLASALLVPGAAQAATFAVSGTTLAINLTAANESVAITSAGSAYDFALTGGTWSGTDGGGATGNGTASLMATAASFTAVTVEDGSTGNAVTFNTSGANTYASTFTVTLDDATAGTITFNGNTAFAGSSALGASTSRNIVVASGAVVSVVNGNLTMSANQQVAARSGTFVGIDLNGGTIRTSGTGAVSLTGKGGSTGDSNFGIQARAGGRVESTQTTSDAGSLGLNGTGGAGSAANFGVNLIGASSLVTSVVGPISISGSGRGTGSGSYGVAMADGATVSSTGTSAATAAIITVVGAGTSTASASGTTSHGVMIDGATSDPLITSVAGNISITGTGGQTSSTGHRGVLLQQGGRIRSTGTGGNSATITIVATGGATGGNNRVGFEMGSASSIASVDGAILITGTAGTGGSGTGQRGISVNGGSSIETTGTGSISLTGTGGTLPADTTRFGVQITGVDSAVRSSTGTGSITVIANTLDLASSGTLNAGANPVSVRPRSNGTAINLGAADTLATPVLGLTDAELDLVTAGSLTIGDANSGAITVSAVISPASYQTLAFGNSVNFAASGGFSADVGPTSASYEKIEVTGTVTITSGATLALAATGGYVWNGTDNFTLLANDASDAIGGTFTGPALANFLGSALTAIQGYARGTGNDLVVGANAAPVATADSLNRPNTTTVAKVLKSDLLGNDSDADGDPLTLTAAGNAQPAGATVTITGNFVVYTAPANNAGNGSFTYTLSAGAHSVTGTVTVTETTTSGGGGGTPNHLTIAPSGNDFIVTFLGVPGGSFRVQYSTAGPPNYDWQEFIPQAIHTAAPNGVFTHTDVNPPSPIRFYRAVSNP